MKLLLTIGPVHFENVELPLHVPRPQREFQDIRQLHRLVSDNSLEDHE